MAEFLLGAACFVLLMVALGFVRIVLGPDDADRMMAVQLLGTGGVAVLLLIDAATGVGAIDVVLTLVLLAAFAAVGFYKNATDAPAGEPDGRG